MREPEFTGKAYCPRCGSLGSQVSSDTLDHHVTTASRSRLGGTAFFCGFAQCDVGYFDLFDQFVAIDELQSTVYPKPPLRSAHASPLLWTTSNPTCTKALPHGSGSCLANPDPKKLNVRRSRLMVGAVCAKSSDFTCEGLRNPETLACDDGFWIRCPRAIGPAIAISPRDCHGRHSYLQQLLPDRCP